MPTHISTHAMMKYLVTFAKTGGAFLSSPFEKKNGSAAYLNAWIARFMKMESL
ncbi:hypothetical protein D3C87_1946440 [compost metagenome]